MKTQRTLLISALAASCFTCAALTVFAQQSTNSEIPDAPQATAEAMTVPNGPYVVMDTSMGRITCQFYQKQAPHAVANFIALAEGTKDWTDPASGKVQHHRRYYDGTIFHRVIPEFMIQGGDPTGTGMGDPGYKFDDEIDPNLNYDRPGRLAMANSGPNTNGSQFFITELPFESGNGHYVLFGQCDDASVDVVKAIARVQRDPSDKPLTPVVLQKVTIVHEGAPMPPLPNAPPAASVVPTQPAVFEHGAEGSHARLLSRTQDIPAGEAEEHLISKKRPVYPKEAKQAHISGTVTVATLIGPDGAVTIAHAIDGPEPLRAAAEEAVMAWRYKPFLVQGQPGTVQTKATIIFQLDN
jgi:peptidyl-prolyl cis-trans isomerase A (cyclophilin A)